MVGGKAPVVFPVVFPLKDCFCFYLDVFTEKEPGTKSEKNLPPLLGVLTLPDHYTTSTSTHTKLVQTRHTQPPQPVGASGPVVKACSFEQSRFS
jgi:hypothetical protein